MEPHVVIGTAGHIDHGKTTLVKALTGVDTDRLAEEKARGITIDLGFAPLDLGGLAASVVDVPGHEAFVRNMVAGATGVDLALLVVAADEGVMPQTREHVAVLRFLGVHRGVVALTKCDLAPDPDWRALVADDVRALLAREVGDAWPVVEVAATAGTGLDALRAALAAAAGGIAVRTGEDRFRLPVDRVFALAGAGTIVTGTAWSGTVAEGDRVLVLPKGLEARVRSIQVHGRGAARALPGRRTSLALLGPGKEELQRGDVVVAGEGWRASRWLDADVTLLAGVRLRLRQRVRLHHGTAEAMARVAVLREQEGPSRLLVRLVMEAALVLRAGDRFVVRSYSPVTTIGGGVVTEPWVDELPRARRARAAPEPLAPEPTDRVAALVRRRAGRGLSRQALEVAAGLGVSALTAALGRTAQLGLVEVNGWLVAGEEVDAAADRMRAALDAWHSAHPLEPGMPAQAWRAAGDGARHALAELAEGRLVAAGEVVRTGAVVRRARFEPGASGAARTAQDRVLAALAAADAEPPSVPELQAALRGVDVPGVLRLLARTGQAIAVADRYYEAAALGREKDRLVAALRTLGPATPAAVRERLGRSRKWLIPLLEWADREGLTVRDGDRRVLKLQAGA